MEPVVQTKFIPQQILFFVAGQRCCQTFACVFREEDHLIFYKCAKSFGLRCLGVMNNGQLCMKVYKSSCRHYMEQPQSLLLSHPTVVDINQLLKTKNMDQIFGSCQRQSLCRNIIFRCISDDLIRPPIPCLMQNEQYRNYPTNFDLLNAIYPHRVLLYNANFYSEKSYLFPLTILKDSERKQSHVKIICIEIEDAVANYNADRLANYLHEKIGETVGIQLLHTNINSSKTHVLFTTAKYFLRSLFVQPTKALNYLTHLIVNDVHLHNAYTDLVLTQLNNGRSFTQNIRLILLGLRCNEQEYLDYFEGSVVLRKKRLVETLAEVSYIDDIRNLCHTYDIAVSLESYRIFPQLYHNGNMRNTKMDDCLRAYEDVGTDTAFRLFIHCVHFEMVPVNYQHSLTGKTAIHIAAKLNRIEHLRTLLYLGGNPLLLDYNHESALIAANVAGNSDCIHLLQNYILKGYIYKNERAQFVDFDMIINILHLICNKRNFSPGNILIILPSYYHMVKLNYMVLSYFLTGHLEQSFIYLLHEHMDPEYTRLLANAPKESCKIVITTSIIESIHLPISFKYLIDTGCEKRTVYDADNSSSKDVIYWVAKDCLLRRLLLLDNDLNDKHCFRLLSKTKYDSLLETGIPDLEIMPLDEICLTVKHLSPHTIIAEYFIYSLVRPPIQNINHAVQLLKKIEALDSAEDITILGCRIINIPLPCQLARTLIFGVFLQCLDPVLTIVSSLLVADPLNLPFADDIDVAWSCFTMYIQNRIKNERSRLGEDQLSDHFIFVRIFEQWQDRMNNQSQSSIHLTDEYDFILNGLLEQVQNFRSQIVMSLRSANLIHRQGQLVIHNLNIRSNNWAVVKAALTGGMYPSLCLIDYTNRCLKSAHPKSITLHPSSVLRNFFEPFNKYARGICSPWTICTKQRDIIKHATIVSPIVVALLTGSTKLGENSIEEVCISASSNTVHYFVDEWIWLSMAKSDFEVMIELRLMFFKYFYYLLHNCCNLDEWNSELPVMEGYTALINTLSSILMKEEFITGFKSFRPFGFRMVLKVPNTYLMSVNAHFIHNEPTCTFFSAVSTLPPVIPEDIDRQYFLLYTKIGASEFFMDNDNEYLEDVIGKFVRPIESPNRFVFVVLYSKNPDMMLSICRVFTQPGKIILKEYFRNVIPVFEVLEICESYVLNYPNFQGRLLSTLISKRLGNLIMDLFAFRHHWIHK